KANAFSPKVSKVIQYIERNLDSNLTLEELANYVDLAPSYLSRIFNQECHQSLSQFITSLRIKKGRDLIARTKMTVAEVANMSVSGNRVISHNVLKNNMVRHH